MQGGTSHDTGGENKGAQHCGGNLCLMTDMNMEREREGEKRGKRRVGNAEERFLEPNSLKKKKKSPRSGWQPRTTFISGFCSRLYKLACSVPVRVYSLVHFESDSLVSWRLNPGRDPEASSLIP